jgi:hypothetical protein
MPHWASDSERSFGITHARKNEHKVWNLECKKSLYIRVTSKELGKCRLDLEGVQDVRLKKEGTE